DPAPRRRTPPAGGWAARHHRDLPGTQAAAHRTAHLPGLPRRSSPLMPPLPSPNLDDRNFDQLMAEAKARIALRAPEWNDLSAHDPGIVLLELFAHLTEVLIYRHN